MPVLESSKRALRAAKRKAALNAVIRKKYKEALKEARKNPTEENIKKAYSLLDKAAKTNVIHKNKAARLKSRLMKLANKIKPKTNKETEKRKNLKTKKLKNRKTKKQK